MALGGGGPASGGSSAPSDAVASGDPEVVLPYRSVGLWLTIQGRLGWLTFFFGGLILAAVVVEAFEEVRSPPRPSGPSGPAPRTDTQTHPPPARGAAGPGRGPGTAPVADAFKPQLRR